MPYFLIQKDNIKIFCRSTVYSSRGVGATYMSIDRGVDKGGVVHVCSGVSLSHEEGLIMSLAATRTDLERVVLREKARGGEIEYDILACGT